MASITGRQILEALGNAISGEDNKDKPKKNPTKKEAVKEDKGKEKKYWDERRKKTNENKFSPTVRYAPDGKAKANQKAKQSTKTRGPIVYKSDETEEDFYPPVIKVEDERKRK